MSAGYHLFEWLVVLTIVGISAWRVWRTYGPKPRSIGTEAAPGCDAGCPTCNSCATTPSPAPPKRDQPIEFRPRTR